MPPKESLQDVVRMAVVRLKDRLQFGAIFSLPITGVPEEMRPNAAGDAHGDAVGAGAGAIVPYAPGALLAVEIILSDAVLQLMSHQIAVMPGRSLLHLHMR